MKKQKRKKSRSTVSIFTYLAYLILLGLGAFLFGLYMNTDGSGSGEFAHYCGPVREGYDLATRLGSDLDFTGLTASLSGTEFIELGDQNFGFDPGNGILDVILDLRTERYYMEVKFKK